MREETRGGNMNKKDLTSNIREKSSLSEIKRRPLLSWQYVTYSVQCKPWIWLAEKASGQTIHLSYLFTVFSLKIRKHVYKNVFTIRFLYQQSTSLPPIPPPPPPTYCRHCGSPTRIFRHCDSKAPITLQTRNITQYISYVIRPQIFRPGRFQGVRIVIRYFQPSSPAIWIVTIGPM